MGIETILDKSISFILAGAFIAGWIFVIYLTITNKKYNPSNEEKIKRSFRHFYHSKPLYAIIVIAIITLLFWWWLNRPVEMIYDPSAPPF